METLVLSAGSMDSGAVLYLFAKVTITSVTKSYMHADLKMFVTFKQVFSEEIR